MELRNLITFTHVAELGSFTKAAEQLGYSQSTISFQIKQLEKELGCLLFERINHTVTLTERGHDLVSYAHQVRALTDEFQETLTTEKELMGHIHIVTPDSVCDDMINSHYIDFHNKYPGISVKFTTADTSVMFDMLDHNEADLIIRYGRLDALDSDPRNLHGRTRSIPQRCDGTSSARNGNLQEPVP